MRPPHPTSHVTLLGAVLMSVVAVTVGCATDPPARAASRAADARTPDAPGEAVQFDDDTARRLEARRIVDRSGASDDCRRPELDTAADAWLGAWCGVHARRWRRAAASARRARRHFATTGELRRQTEMLLVLAIAESHLAGDASQAAARKAVSLFDAARLRLHGPPDDPFSGDLPFLFAYARSLGLLEDHPRRRAGADSRVASLPMLVRTTRWQYEMAGMRAMLPHVEWLAAEHALKTGRFDRAITHLHRGLTVARESNDEVALRRHIGVFADLARRLGHREAARAADAWRPDPPTSHDRRTARAPLEPTSLGADRLRALLAHPTGLRRLNRTLRQLLDAPSARPPPPLVAGLAALADDDFAALEPTPRGRVWAFLDAAGQLLTRDGRHEQARRYYRRAVEQVELRRAAIDEPSLRQRFFRQTRGVYRRLVDTLLRPGPKGAKPASRIEALRVANGIKARGLIDLLDGRVDPERTVEPPSFNWTPAPNILRAADQLRDQLAKWRPRRGADQTAGTAAPLRPAIGLPGDLVDTLDADTAVVEYLVGPRESYVWVVTDRGTQMRRLAGRRTLQPLVERFHKTLVNPDPTPTQRRTHRRLAERLYVELVGPFDDLVVGDTQLVVAADTLLYDLPFETLARPTDAPRPTYLLERHRVTYTPSSAALLRLARHHSAGGPQGDRALILGAPNLDRPALDLLRLAEQLPDAGMFPLRKLFPKLPGSRTELRNINRLLAGSGQTTPTLRTGKDASEHFLDHAALQDYGIIHLATHGVSDARSLKTGDDRKLRFDQPALLLTQADGNPRDGVLTLGEILTWQTRARMVVLSGCTTGRGWRALGEGGYGLAGAFLYTGARNVVASTWDVSDRDTSELMTHLYRAIARGRSPAAALNAGQRAVMHDPRGGTRPPFYWAGFRTIGGASML